MPSIDYTSAHVELHALADLALMIAMAQAQAGGSARLCDRRTITTTLLRREQQIGQPVSMLCSQISTQLPRQRLWRPVGMVDHAEQAENHAMFVQDLATDAMPRSALQPPAGQP